MVESSPLVDLVYLHNILKTKNTLKIDQEPFQKSCATIVDAFLAENKGIVVVGIPFICHRCQNMHAQTRNVNFLFKLLHRHANILGWVGTTSCR